VAGISNTRGKVAEAAAAVAEAAAVA